MRHDFFEQALLLQAVAGELVVADRVDGDGRLRQPIGQCLLARRQRLEAGCVQLNEGGVADALDEDVAGLFLLAECEGGDGEDCEQKKECEILRLQGGPPCGALFFVFCEAERTSQATTNGLARLGATPEFYASGS